MCLLPSSYAENISKAAIINIYIITNQEFEKKSLIIRLLFFLTQFTVNLKNYLLVTDSSENIHINS